MKLSKRTLGILKNFSDINMSLVFDEGSSIKTMSPSKGIVAIAEVDEEFPTLAPIYDMNRFLSIVSTYKEPDVDFKEDRAIISEGDTGKQKATQTYADASMIISPKKKTFDFPSADIALTLTNETLERVLKRGSILGLEDIAFLGENGKLILRALDSEGSIDNKYDEELGETEDEFVVVIKTSNLKILPGDYEVEISRKGISKFQGENIVYYVAVNSKHSKF